MSSNVKNLIILFILIFGFLTECALLEKDEIILSVTSPDGNAVAYVTKFRPCFDDPCQKLWLKRPEDKNSIMLEKLNDDMRWCSQIQWTPNGKKVAFLIMQKYLYIYEVSNAKLAKEIDLVPSSRDYPPHPFASNFSFSDDGRKVKFKKVSFQIYLPSERGIIKKDRQEKIFEIDIGEPSI